MRRRKSSSMTVRSRAAQGPNFRRKQSRATVCPPLGVSRAPVRFTLEGTEVPAAAERDGDLGELTTRERAASDWQQHADLTDDNRPIAPNIRHAAARYAASILSEILGDRFILWRRRDLVARFIGASEECLRNRSLRRARLREPLLRRAAVAPHLRHRHRDARARIAPGRE